MRNFIYYNSLTGFVLMMVLVAAHSSGQTIVLASGKVMGSALTLDDFTKAGVPVSRLQEANLDDNKSAYRFYDGKAGKVELDIFYAAGDTPAEAQSAQRAQSAIRANLNPGAAAAYLEHAEELMSEKKSMRL